MLRLGCSALQTALATPAGKVNIVNHVIRLRYHPMRCSQHLMYFSVRLASSLAERGSTLEHAHKSLKICIGQRLLFQ